MGIDKVTSNPQGGPYLFFDLNFIDWDHSLLMVIVWACVWGLIYAKNLTIAMIATATVLLHFIFDLPVHNHDLALYPYSSAHLGYGLWSKASMLSWLLEGVLSAGLIMYPWVKYSRLGVSLLWPSIMLTILFIHVSPRLSPMQYFTPDKITKTQIVFGMMTSLGYILPGLLLTWQFNLIDRRT